MGYPFALGAPSETDDRGRYSLNGRDWIKAGYPYTPLRHAREAEQWQAERKRG